MLNEYKYSRTVQYLSCYVASVLGLIPIAYIIMTMHVFSMNMAGGDNRGVLNVASFTCLPVPLMSGHLSCTDTFAWSRGCPFMAGTTVVTLPACVVHSYCKISPCSKLPVQRNELVTGSRNVYQ